MSVVGKLNTGFNCTFLTHTKKAHRFSNQNQTNMNQSDNERLRIIIFKDICFLNSIASRFFQRPHFTPRSISNCLLVPVEIAQTETRNLLSFSSNNCLENFKGRKVAVLSY